jgi:L-amino acid N-acyltransferase YncA
MGATRIRLAAAGDGAACADIYRPAVDGSATSFEAEAPGAAEMASRITTTLERFPWVVCEIGSSAAGYAYATAHRTRTAYQWSVEVSAYVSADHHRRGVGRALYTSLFEILKLQGFRNAYAGITLPNDASVGLHSALGFSPLAVYRGIGYKLGRWHDVGWMELALLPRDPDVAPPRWLPELDPADMAGPLTKGVALLRLG